MLPQVVLPQVVRVLPQQVVLGEQVLLRVEPRTTVRVLPLVVWVVQQVVLRKQPRTTVGEQEWQVGRSVTAGRALRSQQLHRTAHEATVRLGGRLMQSLARRHLPTVQPLPPQGRTRRTAPRMERC